MISVKLVLIVMLLGVSGSYARVWSQADRMTVKTEKVNLVEFFGVLQQKTDLRFVFNHEDVQNYDVRVDANEKTLSEVLDIALTGKPLKYEITSNHVIISHTVSRAAEQQAPTMVTVTGTVRDKATNTPIKGVSVIDTETKAGISTDDKGSFSLNVPRRDRITLSFRSVGMKTQDVVWTGRGPLNVVMEVDVQSIEEVIVTGYFERKAESFTGSAATFNRDQLRSVSSGNLLESLRSLDPAVSYNTDDLYGSDPNRLPDISIRGKTSVVDPRNSLTSDPNQPLYILDGFQASASQIANLNLNRIQSVTILKDATSTAIYGAQAANGVIVIETVKPQLGHLRVEYNGNFSAQFADFSDYNLMNAQEKLEVEVLSGIYDHPYASNLYDRTTLYNARLERVLRGVDTYWLKVPVRTGFTNKHNVNIGGGDQTLVYGLGLTYANTNGVMKKSANNNAQFNFNLQYRSGQFQFSNIFTLENHQMENPPVAFSVYAQTNPYYEILPSSVRFLEAHQYPTSKAWIRVANPLYLESLKFIDESRRLTVSERFYTEWRPLDGLKITGRIQVELGRERSEKFKSPFHTDYEETVSSERGNYKKSYIETNEITGNVTASYYKTFAEKHQVFANASAGLTSSNTFLDGYEVVGFADDIIPYPTFGEQYKPGTLPTYGQGTTRRANFFLQTGYVYDHRYSFDFTVRQDGSSNFGRGKLFKNFWSTGFAWSLHRESFLQGKLEMLKLRFSIGKLGNDNTTYTTETIYKYYALSNAFGSGLHIDQYGNFDLDWENTLDMNIGLDLTTLNRRFSMTVDAYQKVTDPMILNLDTPASTARSNMRTNNGRNTNTGINFDMFYYIISRHAERISWGVGVNGRHERSEYSRVSNMSKLNDELRELNSFSRIFNGASSTDIWAVRSAGIDPGTGEEIFIKKDGTYTRTFDKDDEVVVGNSRPKLEGRIRSTVQYKGFSLGIYMYYRFGEDYMNYVLQNRIEGLTETKVMIYNQDKRALHDRWKSVGDIAQFKKITDLNYNNKYVRSDRFLQKRNWFAGESISLGYSFDTQGWLRAANIENITVRAVMNDLFHWSTVKIERGIEYPYARTASLNVSITF